MESEREMTTIVDTPPTTSTPDDGGHDRIEAIYQRVLDETPRFLGTLDGQEFYSPFALALVMNEIVAERETTAVRELTGELGTADDQVRYLVDLLVTSDETVERLRADNERLRAEMSGREPTV